MRRKGTLTYEPVDASPLKSFFVSMLTRDIRLEEAILDLLDNSVDGILRSIKQPSTAKPYHNYHTDITISESSFIISDNCGGIPWDLHDYAFRMGRAADRPPDRIGTVGAYGIGMKRAIFKMGARCLITTQNNNASYVIGISPDWISDESTWTIPVRPTARRLKEDGTIIEVTDIYPGIAERFSANGLASFKAELERTIATHYAFIIEKGFAVKVNGDTIKPRPTKIVFSKKEERKSIKPFIFKSIIDEVEIFLAVGFTRPIPSSDEVINAQEETQYSSLDAGWTVLCNDRAVLYCDRSELTGWGEAGVPRYHTQFIAIAGIVEFRAHDATKLPTTTTKRGIDASSSLYLQVKNKMREGMLIFTDYTNKWKGKADESKKHIDAAGEPLPFEQIKEKAQLLSFNTTRRTLLKGEQFKPSLPMPERAKPSIRRIAYNREIEQIESVADYLFGDKHKNPSDVGAECFDRFWKESSR